MNIKILILRIFPRKMTILRKILRIRLTLRIKIFVNTGPEYVLYLTKISGHTDRVKLFMNTPVPLTMDS